MIKFNQLIYLFLFLPTLLLSQKKEDGKYQGLLWEISKPGVSEKSYLYGTMHVSSKVAFHLTDSFYVAIGSVDVVGLETNPETWLKDMLNSEAYSFYMHNGFRIKNYGFYKNEFNLTRLNNKGLKYLLSYDSQFSNNLLYRKSQGYQNNFQEDTYLDMFIFQTGKKLGKVVTNLEDFEESQKLVAESQIADRKSENYATRSQYDFGDKDPFEIIEDAYRNGDLDLLDSIGRITGTEEGRKFMLYIRNQNIANSIDSIINGGQTVFGAVGAAHLPGDEGVIESLRTLGYTLRPVTKSKKSETNQKEKIDKMIHPFELREISSSDGAFTTMLPDEIIEPPLNIIYSEYQIPDMPNGGNYFIRRVNTYGPLFGESEEYLQKRIDSLLFENIPGKIIEINQKEKDQNGHPIITITNETKQGDFQQYKIIITPFELYVFKVIGIKEYAKQKEVQPFIDNATVNYDYKQDWREISPYYKGFKVELPGAVKIQDTRQFTSLNKNAFIQAYDRKSESYFALIQTSLSDSYYIEEDTFELKYIADKFCEETKFEDISGEEFSKIGDYATYYHQGKNKDGDILHCKTIIKGAHYYLLLAQTKKKGLAERYFDSFEFQDFEIKSTPQMVVDTALLFKVKTYASNPRSSYDQLYNSKYAKDEDEDVDFKNKKEYIAFFFAETGEEVNVIYNKFHDYEYQSLDESYKNSSYIFDFISDDVNDLFDFEEYTLDELIDYYDSRGNEYGNTSSEYVVSNNNFIKNKNNSIKWKEYLITRKNSSRGIYGRFIVYKDRYYNLRTTIDTLQGPSMMVRHFMDNFEPLDTLVGKPINEEKDSLFITHLIGKDSLLQTRALRSINTVDLKERNMKSIHAILDTMDFAKFENGFRDRLDLIQRSGHIDSPDHLQYLERKYKEAEDTSSIQISILKAITTLENEENHKLFIKLLLQETPLTEASKINGLFNYLEDSIVMNKILYPQLFELSSVPEYTNNVYEILVTLLDSGYIERDFYANKLDYLYREAKMEMKRFNNKTIDENESGSKYNYNSEYILGFTYLGNEKLSNLLRLLAPFRRDDERIEKLFTKMLSIKNIQSICFTSRLLKKDDVKTPTKIWTELLSLDEKYAFPIFLTLSDLEDPESQKELNISNEMIARSILLYETKLELDKKDSLKLHTIRKLNYKNEPLDVYVFKYKQEPKYGTNKPNWKLAIIGVLPESKLSPYFPELIISNISIKLNKDTEDIIDEKLKSLRFIGRERVQIIDDNSYYDY